MSGKYALIIGNTEYIDPGLAQLTAPGKDAEDFARVLKDKDICAFDGVKVLLNQLSSSAIEVIDEFFDQRKPDDLLVLYFSGHGVRDELGSLYLAFTNTIRSRLRSTAIKSDYIKEAMDGSRSKRQVLILDCCNSGAFQQGTKAEVGGTMGLTLAFQGYGRFVLTASDATQFAWEGDKVIGSTDNSLFTHFLLKGLEGEADSDSDGNITVDELYDYAYEQVSKVTPKQTPTKSSSKAAGDIILRQITHIEDIKPVALPDDLFSEIENPYPEVRLRAVGQLAKLLKNKNLGLVRSAREVLERMEKEDDSRRVSQAATQVLEAMRRAEPLAAELQVRQKAEEELIAKAKIEVRPDADQAATNLDTTGSASSQSLEKTGPESGLPKSERTTTSSQPQTIAPKGKTIPKWGWVAIGIGLISGLMLCLSWLGGISSMSSLFPIKATYTPTQTLTSTSQPKPTSTTQLTVTNTSSPTTPPCFKLLTPEDGANLAAIGKFTFTWEAMTGAARYLLLITTPNRTLISFESEYPMIVRYAESLPSAGKYEWEVTSYDNNGEVLCKTDSFSFTKPETDRPTPTTGKNTGGSQSSGGPGDTPVPTKTAKPTPKK